MGKVTSVKIIDEVENGRSLMLEVTIDGVVHTGKIRRKTMEMLKPIFREHEEEIKDWFGGNKLGVRCSPLERLDLL
ncbi:TPA: hypothetical protein QCX73_005668 [Bacillus mycoides]|nr:hypothetical protein [Bacillus mycoides]HDR7630943.1 hypothetical protein [Bacillus mycoides]